MQSTSYDETTVNTAALLNTYMYLDNHAAQNGCSIRNALLSLKSLPEYGSPGGKHYESWKLLSKAAQSSFGDLILDHQSDTMGFPAQTNACTFTDPASKDVFVVYRGTADGEWPDNGAGLFSVSTLQQEDAVLYFNQLAERGYLDTPGSVYISGHSKGGNKAQFVTLASAYSEKIDQCLSFDGQGFAPKAIGALQELMGAEEFERRRHKLHSICGDNDFVNVLGCSVVPMDHTVYVETDPGPWNPAGYHDIKYLFAKRGTGGSLAFDTKLNPQAPAQGGLAKYVSSLSAMIMNLPDDDLADCAMGLTKLIELGGRQNVGIHEGAVTAEEVLGLLKHGISLVFSTLPLAPESKAALLALPIAAPAVLQGGALTWALASALDSAFSNVSPFSPLQPGLHADSSLVSGFAGFGSPSDAASIYLSFTKLSPLAGLIHESLLYLEQARQQISHIRLIPYKTARNQLKRLAIELAQEAEQLKDAKDTLDGILLLYQQTERRCLEGWFRNDSETVEAAGETP